MLHREERCQEEKEYNAEFGAEDTFSMDEMNPYDTGAIDSCLWELETLQSHYHPNVASLARILSQQFTKPQYNLEDFLDHSYHGVSPFCDDLITLNPQLVALTRPSLWIWSLESK